MYLDIVVNPFVRAMDKVPVWAYLAGVLVAVGILLFWKLKKKK